MSRKHISKLMQLHVQRSDVDWFSRLTFIRLVNFIALVAIFINDASLDLS